jgi:hypothetical protein
MLGFKSVEVATLRKLVERLPQKSFVNDVSKVEPKRNKASRRKRARAS